MDIENRIYKARAAFSRLLIVWRNNNLSTNLMLPLFQSSEDSDQKAEKCLNWHTLRKGEDNIARMAMEWNPFDGLGRAPGGQCQTWRQAIERKTKKLGKKLARSEITSQEQG